MGSNLNGMGRLKVVIESGKKYDFIKHASRHVGRFAYLATTGLGILECGE